MGKRVGVLGSGQVAKVLAVGFKKHGYDVKVGSRDPAKLAQFALQEGLAAGSFAETAAFGSLVVLAVHGQGAHEALQQAGAAQLAEKVVIDATNPIADEPPENGVIRFFTGPNDSLMERLQAGFPRVRFVKAWNSVGSRFMVDPSFAGGPPTMFICGNDERAKTEVAAILAEFGWSAVDMGLVESARAIEPLCQLWCVPGLLRNQWGHAFKLLTL
jgi:8-hydroxy-5-deazaflavin:NADPH oxidoreductase